MKLRFLCQPSAHPLNGLFIFSLSCRRPIPDLTTCFSDVLPMAFAQENFTNLATIAQRCVVPVGLFEQVSCFHMDCRWCLLVQSVLVYLNFHS